MNNHTFDVFFVYINIEDDIPTDWEWPSDTIVIRRSSVSNLLFLTICVFDDLEKSAEEILRKWEQFSRNKWTGKAIFTVCHIRPLSQGVVLSSKLIKMISDMGLSLRYLRNKVSLAD